MGSLLAFFGRIYTFLTRMLDVGWQLTIRVFKRFTDWTLALAAAIFPLIYRAFGWALSYAVEMFQRVVQQYAGDVEAGQAGVVAEVTGKLSEIPALGEFNEGIRLALWLANLEYLATVIAIVITLSAAAMAFASAKMILNLTRGAGA